MAPPASKCLCNALKTPFRAILAAGEAAKGASRLFTAQGPCFFGQQDVRGPASFLDFDKTGLEQRFALGSLQGRFERGYLGLISGEQKVPQDQDLFRRRLKAHIHTPLPEVYYKWTLRGRGRRGADDD